MSAEAGGNGAALCAHTWIDDADMYAAIRKIWNGATPSNRTFQDVLWADVMADISNLDLRYYPPDHTFHNPYIAITQTEVC